MIRMLDDAGLFCVYDDSFRLTILVPVSFCLLTLYMLSSLLCALLLIMREFQYTLFYSFISLHFLVFYPVFQINPNKSFNLKCQMSLEFLEKRNFVLSFRKMI